MLLIDKPVNLQLTYGLAKVGQDIVIFGINNIAASVPAGQTSLDFLQLNLYFCFSISSGCGADGILFPNLRQALLVVRNPKTKFRSPSSDMTFNAKPLTSHRTLQHICKAHKTDPTIANLAKELQLPRHSKQSNTLTANHYRLHLHPMKFLTLIFALYILTLSCVPCMCDDIAKSETTQQTKNTPTKDKNHNDNCTPFCTCTCCCASAYFHIKTDYFTIKPIVSTSTKKFALVDKNYSSYKCHNIWQPPKLSY